jgi:hypothetical protein
LGDELLAAARFRRRFRCRLLAGSRLGFGITKFPVPPKKFPVIEGKFPVVFNRNWRLSPSGHVIIWLARAAKTALFPKIPCYFPVKQGI